jgi:DoxX-like family
MVAERSDNRFGVESSVRSSQVNPVSKGRLWAGRIISALPALFLIMDGVMKLVKPAIVVDTTVHLGYSESTIVPIGIVLLICTGLYLFPRTSVLGAILLTGFLGAAEGVFPIVFPVIVGALLWLGLYLRDDRLRSLVPWRNA